MDDTAYTLDHKDFKGMTISEMFRLCQSEQWRHLDRKVETDTLADPRGRQLSAPPSGSKFFHFHEVFGKIIAKQECIPVGCVPPAFCPYLPACTAPGVGVCMVPGGCTWSGGGTWSRGVLAQVLPPCGQTAT